mmetsp:Transcript_27754/g.61940  ORF Transcript_27754/g.61940 Transcript_27754/m.61940 type:complete len:115 (+) Transcript_27754:2741-3085(+)
MAGHLGIVVPGDSAGAGDSSGSCGMNVLGRELSWDQDRVVVFQNCFPHHTWNDTPHDRILLYFDFWHPELTLDERRAIAALEATRRRYEAKAAEEISMPPNLAELLNRTSARRR